MVSIMMNLTSIKSPCCTACTIMGRGKRIVLTTAVYLRALHRFTEADVHDLERCAGVFGLVKDVRALELPRLLFKTILDQAFFEKIWACVEVHHVDEAIEYVLARVPKWLRYGDIAMMREDIRRAVMSAVEDSGYLSTGVIPR